MSWRALLFGGWPALARTLVVGVLAYAALVLLLRIVGKRSISKFNAFDFVVTVALGSTLATVLLSKDVALAQGILALAVLLGLQFAITWLSVRSSRVRTLIVDEPTLLLHRGDFLDAAMRRARVTGDEVVAAARLQGVGSVSDIDAAVLETDGSISIVRRASPGSGSTVSGVPMSGDAGQRAGTA